MIEQQKLRIAIITNNYTPYSGGVVSSICSFTKELRARNHRVFIITLDFLGKEHQDEPDVIRILCPIKFMHKKNHIAIPWRPDYQVKKSIQKIAPDIIHLQHPMLLGSSGLKAGRKLNIPVVFTYHTQYEKYLHNIPLPESITAPLTKKLVEVFCASVDRIIAPSGSIKNYLLDQQIKTPIEVIASGILPVFISSRHTPRSGQKPFQLLTVSRFTKEKNISFLLDLFARLDQNMFTFDLIGYGQHLEQLKAHAYHKLQFNPNIVRFIEHPPKPLIARYYRTSDLFIFASTTETQGLVLAESMAGGTPIIALLGPGQEDIIENGINGFLVDTADQMQEKIIQLANNIDLHNQLSKNAWRTAQEYTPAKSTEKLINIYLSLATNGLTP